MKGLADLNTTIGDQRWLTTGWTIYNNKGNPVRKFEPFFSTTHQYEFETVVGVSKTLLYDALQRNILSINPDHTWTKTVTTPWSGQSWDASDTLLLDPLNDPDVKGYFQLLPKDDFLPGWYDARTGRLDGGMGSKDREAAMMAALYAGTPSTSFFDAFGRRIVMAMHNRRKHSASQHPGSGKHEKRPNGVEDEFVLSRMYYDVVGNTLKVKDARGRIVQRNTYDMTKRSMRKESMEAGKAWTLVDCGGKTVLAWDGRGFEELLVYDTNGRAVREYLRKIGDDGGCDEVKTPALVLVITYGEEEKGAEQRNARGRMVFVRDQTGTKRMESFDFRSNLLGETHVLSGKMDGLIDWSDSEAVSVENESWTTHMTYDALNRVVQRTEPDGSLVRQLYNRSSQIKRVEMKLCGTKGWRDVLSNAEYNARGQPVLRVLGNGVQTRCEHDPLTFRLIRLLSLSRTWTRSGCDADHGRPSSPRVHTLQDFKYTYDPMGNIISIQDDSNEPIFFNNQKVNPSNEYSYDALYRLITASGREHLGLTQQQSDPGDPYQVRSYSAEDGHAMSRYHEELFYDKAGNMTKLQHHGNSSWTKHFSYDEPSQLEPKKHKNNRLSSTRVGKDVGAFKYEGSEGLVGNMTTMPSLSVIRWDFRSQLQATARQRCEGIPETTYYQYTDGGQRKRKVTMRRVETGSKEQATRKSDRVYLGSFEIFRKYGVDGKSINLERQTLSISVGDERLVVQEVLTAGTSPGPAQLTRYQLGNHLGSAVLELDASAKTLTYEEYFPYGGTSYQASLSQVDAPKRYRYSGKERDEESGLYYYGSRYYSTSIARWISPDPAGMRDNTNLYLFVRCNPITYKDPDGQQLEEVMSSPVAWAEIGAAALAVGEVVLGAISLPVLIVAVVAVAAVVALEYAAEDERDYELKGPKWYPDAPKTPAPWESPPEPDTLPPGGPPETPPVEPPTAPPEAPPETPPTTPEPTTPEPTGPETTPKPVEPEPGTDTTVKPKPDIDVGPDDIADPLPDPKPDPKPRRPPDKDWHHIYPQVYRGIFEQAGIQIDIDAAKNGRMVDRQYHHKFSSAFQKDWTIFLFSSVDEYGKMRKTRAEIEKEALILADKYGTWVVETGRHQSHPVPRPWLTP